MQFLRCLKSLFIDYSSAKYAPFALKSAATQGALFQAVETAETLDRLRSDHLGNLDPIGILLLFRTPSTAETPSKVHLPTAVKTAGAKPRKALKRPALRGVVNGAWAANRPRPFILHKIERPSAPEKLA